MRSAIRAGGAWINGIANNIPNNRLFCLMMGWNPRLWRRWQAIIPGTGPAQCGSFLRFMAGQPEYHLEQSSRKQDSNSGNAAVSAMSFLTGTSDYGYYQLV